MMKRRDASALLRSHGRLYSVSRPHPQPATGRDGRLVALDAFRGITIAGMILVNNPGTWDDV